VFDREPYGVLAAVGQHQLDLLTPAVVARGHLGAGAAAVTGEPPEEAVRTVDPDVVRARPAPRRGEPAARAHGVGPGPLRRGRAGWGGWGRSGRRWGGARRGRRSRSPDRRLPRDRRRQGRTAAAGRGAAHAPASAAPGSPAASERSRGAGRGPAGRSRWCRG